MSMTAAALPSRCAAMARIAPMVTTPVPPTPVISMAIAVAQDRHARRIGQVALVRGRRPPCFRTAPCTVTKLGQKPLRQEMSLLQVDWSMARFRPNSVSTGSMATQFDCTPQSPQPSQTSSLMTTRLSGSGAFAALASPPLLGRAGLVVDQHRQAAALRQLPLHRVEIVAMMDVDAGRQAAAAGGSARGSSLTTTTCRAPSAEHLRCDLVDRQAAVQLLPAGQRHRVVEQDVEGDVGAGGHRRADHETAGVVVGAVADVLEDMAAGRERRLADPVGALAAHLGVALGLPVHPLRPCSGSRCRHRRASLRAPRCRVL